MASPAGTGIYAREEFLLRQLPATYARLFVQGLALLGTQRKRGLAERALDKRYQ